MIPLFLALLLGCPAQVPTSKVPVADGAIQAETGPLAGEVSDGRFRDQRYGWELPIPEGWMARPGPDAGLMRVAVQRVASDVSPRPPALSPSTLRPG